MNYLNTFGLQTQLWLFSDVIIRFVFVLILIDVSSSGLPRFLILFCCCLVAKLCSSLLQPMDYSLPGSFVHGISQARILEWVDISFSRGSSPPRDQTTSPALSGKFFTSEPPGKPFQCGKQANKLPRKNVPKALHTSSL